MSDTNAERTSRPLSGLVKVAVKMNMFWQQKPSQLSDSVTATYRKGVRGKTA